MSDGIGYNARGDAVSFSGTDAVDVFRAAVLSSSLGLLQKGIVPTRGLTRTRALSMVTRYTGQTYKRTDAEINRAREDLRVWIETMKSALPSTGGAQ